MRIKTLLAASFFVFWSVVLSLIHPLWPDEGFTAKLLNYSPLTIIRITAHDVHPPLYYLLLKLWSLIFGHSELGFRSFSIFLALSTFVVAAKLLKLLKLPLKPWLIIACGLLPFYIRYATEARMYALGSLEVLLLNLVFVQLRRRPNTKNKLLYGVFAAAGFYTQYLTILLVPLHLLVALFRSPHSSLWRKLRQLVSVFWLPAMVLAVLILPWLPVLAHQTGGVYDVYWIPRVTIRGLRDALLQVTNYYLVLTGWRHVLGIIARIIAVAGLVVAVVLTLKKKNLKAFFLPAILPFAVLLMVALSLPPLKPIFDPRYMALFVFSFYLGIVAIFGNFLPKKFHWLGLAAFCLALFSGLVNVASYYQADQNSKPAMEYLNDHYQTGDTLVVDSIFVYYTSDYYNHTGAPLKVIARTPAIDRREWAPVYEQTPQLIIASYQPLSGRVWVIIHPNEEVKGLPQNWQECGRGGGSQVVAICYQT